MSEPHCVRERESEFRTTRWANPLLNRLPHLEKPVLSLAGRNLHVCFQEPFLRYSSAYPWDWQPILTVVQKISNGCPRRARTSGGTVDDRVRGRSGGGVCVAFGYMNNP